MNCWAIIPPPSAPSAALAGPGCGSTAARTSRPLLRDEGGQPLLGAVTLEIFSLGIDPVNERLIPVEAFMLASTTGRPSQEQFHELGQRHGAAFGE